VSFLFTQTLYPSHFHRPVSERIDKKLLKMFLLQTPLSHHSNDSNVNQPLLQYAHELFYQQQALGAWEHERGFE
jgi:hypothetical protein